MKDGGSLGREIALLGLLAATAGGALINWPAAKPRQGAASTRKVSPGTVGAGDQ